MKKNLLSFFAVAVLMLISAVGYAQTTYTKITSASELEVGANYLIVAHYDDLGVLAMGYQKPSNRNAVVVSENGESITVTPGTNPESTTEVFQITLGGSTGAWTLFDEVANGYLYASSSSQNQLKTQATLDDNGRWSIEFNNDGTAEVVAQGANERNNMRFNPNTSNNAPLFSCYASSSNIDTRVSFYKADGAPVINPEPSNYPTNFGATVDGVDVTLTWDDAVGGQLPSKYLVVGSTGDITVPTDGTPVANGELVKNVNYGVETVSFNGLEANTTYHFAIFPYTNSGANIDYKTDGTYPFVHPVTADFPVFELPLNEDFNVENSLGVFRAVSVTGEQVWHQGSYQGTTYANMNGYVGGTTYENEDWLITGIDPGDYADIFLEFRTAMKFNGNPLQVKLSLNYNNGANPGSATWENLTDAFDFSTGEFEWVESGRFNIGSMVQGQRFWIAFVYTCTADAASSWEIDYVKVTGGEVSVGENAFSTVSVYPNPAKDVVSFVLENDAQVSVYDVTGRLMSSMTMPAGEGNCQISSFENGVYFLNIRYADGKKEVARFVKY